MDVERFEDVWRREAPYVLAALLRRHGDVADCEDAVQEAAEAAATQWARDGMPAYPRGWLVTVASRRLVDRYRADRTRADRETSSALDPAGPPILAPPADEPSDGADDSLLVLLLCCHPSLSRASQVALTLRSVAGFSPGQIAAAFGVPEQTMRQRLTRARTTLRTAGARFERPRPAELPERVAAVLDVCHLMFNEGYTRSGGDRLVDVSLTEEAIRLTRGMQRDLPDHDEVAGALALMLLTHARTPARVDEHGDLIPLADQDRSQWDADLIHEGVGLLEDVLPRGPVGRFQLQAAIAAVHAETPTWEETDWAQIDGLYTMLDRVAPSPFVTLNWAVAVAMAHGPEEALAEIDALLAIPAMDRHHRTHAVRAHLLERVGDLDGAAAAYRRAARLATSTPEQRYLNTRLNALTPGRPTRR